MKTILVINKIKIECDGLATYPISDFIKGKLEIAHKVYNRACESLKAEYATTLPKYPIVEAEWLKLQDWLGTYNVVNELLHSHREGKKTFPNMAGYIEVIK